MPLRPTAPGGAPPLALALALSVVVVVVVVASRRLLGSEPSSSATRTYAASAMRRWSSGDVSVSRESSVAPSMYLRWADMGMVRRGIRVKMGVVRRSAQLSRWVASGS